MRLPTATLVLAVLAGPAAAASVSLPVPPGYVPKYSHESHGQMIVEFTPRNESVTHWTHMITLVSAPGQGRIPPPAYVAEFAKRYVAGCPGATASAVPMGREAGVRIDCARSGETVFARALSAGAAMQLVQVAIKGLVLPREAAAARSFLGAVALKP